MNTTHDISSTEAPQLPYIVTQHYASLIEKATHNDNHTHPHSDWYALSAQVTPSTKEQIITPHELSDPLGENLYRVTSRLIHQYRNRVLLLTTGSCLSYCRHCFRRHYTARSDGFITPAELQEVCKYIEQHPEIDEILVSGGDPLTASNTQLANLFSSLRKAQDKLIIRLCTRAPVFLPQRFDDELISILKANKPIWLIPHINHNAEISAQTEKALTDILCAGIPIQSQTVLLKNINDSLETLVTLFNQLVRLGVKPGYLFQCDMAEGTSHLRVPIDIGLNIYQQLQKELSGLSLPVYAVDLPSGGGKFNLGIIRLSESIAITKTNTDYVFTNQHHKMQWRYPRES